MWAVLIGVVLCALAWAVVLWAALPLWYAGALTAALGLGFVGRLLWRQLTARRATRSLERSLASQAEAAQAASRPDQRAQLAHLQAEFEKAVGALKASKLARGRGGALYALPWYMIIGPSGAGKSTALMHSGLQFPYERGPVKGVGGTRDCDWWLSNDAVLLDTAGRYATERDDQAEWFAFLRMLQRVRSRQPINGLLVAVPADALYRSEDELVALGRTLRERVDEIAAELKVNAPVYVVVTKADLITGFRDTFARLTRSERKQVFGFTLPVQRGREGLAEAYRYHFPRLVQLAERRALEGMASERSREGRAAIYRFPQQLEALERPLGLLVEALFEADVFRGAPLCRGVYFTSGTQEGSPIDRVTDALSAQLGIAPGTFSKPVAEPRSYFIEDLLRRVLFPDKALVQPTDARHRRLLMGRVATAAAIALCAAGLTAVGTLAFGRNRAFLAETAGRVQSAAAAIRSGPASRYDAVKTLTPLRETLRRLQAWATEGPPWGMGFGLYQGEALREPMARYYASTLRAALMKPAVDGLSERMETIITRHGGVGEVPTVEVHARLYEALKAYLLLTGVGGEQPQLQGETLAALTESLVRAERAGAGAALSAPELTALGEHIRAYLALLRSDAELLFPRDERVVAKARAVLARIPPHRLAVDRLVAAVEPLGWGLDLGHIAGGASVPISAAGRIRGAFTRRGWEDSVRPLLALPPAELLGETWVLGAISSGERRGPDYQRCQLRGEYFERYLDEWLRFIGSVRVSEASGTAGALSDLQDLTRGQPTALQRLFRTVAEHAQLEPEAAKPPLVKGAEEKASGLLDSLKAKLVKVGVEAPSAQLDACERLGMRTARQVRERLRGFYSFGAGGGDGQLTPLQIYQEQLMFLRDALQVYSEDPATIDALMARLQTARTRVRGLIESQQVGWRPRFDAILWPPINGASVSSGRALAAEKGAQWCSSAFTPFVEAFARRYPFSKHGQDASLQDVEAYFRDPSGTLWSFYESTLQKHVRRIGKRFVLKETQGAAPVYTRGLVDFLNAARRLTDSLFPRGAEHARASFEVRVRPAPGVASVSLTVDGQQVEYHNGPERWVGVQWPSDAGPRGAALRVRGAAVREDFSHPGEWGLLRLLDRGQVSTTAGQRFFTVRWGLGTDQAVVIDFRPARQQNPFVAEGRLLGAFRQAKLAAPAVITLGADPCSK